MFRKEDILDLKTGTDEFVSSSEASVQEKGICYDQKWTQNNYRMSYMLLFGSKEAAVEELRRNCDEL